MAGLNLSVVQSFHQFSGPLNTGVTDSQNISHFIKQSQVLKAGHVTALLASTAISVCINIYKSEVFFVKYSPMIYYGTRSVDETQIIIKSKGDRL